jgi:hypothetical protein
MATLIKDLSRAEELDRKAMAAAVASSMIHRLQDHGTSGPERYAEQTTDAWDQF